MGYYSNITPHERLNKICDLLVRGIYLHAEDKGWIEKPEADSKKPLRKKVHPRKRRKAKKKILKKAKQIEFAQWS